MTSTTLPGARERDAAIARADAAAPGGWRAAADEAVAKLAATGREFTSDDVWALVGAPPEPRALGAVVRRARAAGLIVPAGTRNSTRPESHQRPLTVWKGADRPASAPTARARASYAVRRAGTAWAVTIPARYLNLVALADSGTARLAPSLAQLDGATCLVFTPACDGSRAALEADWLRQQQEPSRDGA